MRFLLAFLLFAIPVRAERAIALIFQPLSLLGTDLEAIPLGSDEPIAADIFPTPAIVSSAYPEDIVQAIGKPYRFYNAPEGFPQESNLIVLSGGTLSAAWGEAKHSITIDFSKVSIPEELGINLRQLCELTFDCLSRTLQQGDRDGKSFDLIWNLPASSQRDLSLLPKVIQAKSRD